MMEQIFLYRTGRLNKKKDNAQELIQSNPTVKTKRVKSTQTLKRLIKTRTVSE